MAKPETTTRIETNGGIYIGGNVDTGGSDFAGRDKIIHGDFIAGDKIGRDKTEIRIGDVGPGANINIQVEHQAKILAPPFMAPNEVPDFVGRHELIEELTSLLTTETGQALIGIVGLGGVGKTSLAIQITHALKNYFPDGVLWANLRLSKSETVIESFAAEFHQAEEVGKRPDLSSKITYVREILTKKDILIVLDNVESSEQIQYIRDLIPRESKVRTLITSRNRKMLNSLKAKVINVAPWNLTESIAYLRSIVGSERVNAEPEAAVKIAEYVGGLPLALSIAAGRLTEQDEITLAEYNRRLEKIETRLKPLKDWDDASRNVYVTFEATYRSLPPVIQQLFASLAAFDGPDFGSAAVLAINSFAEEEVSDGLGQLCSLSFVNPGLGERDSFIEIQPESKGRYRLHALLKAFALTKLENSVDHLRSQLAIYYTDLGQRYSHPPGYPVLDLEWQNIVVALEWAYKHQEWATLLQGVLGLTRSHLGQMGFLDVRGYWSEARRILTWAHEGLANIDNPLQKSHILTNLGGFAVRQTDFEIARLYLGAALEILDQQSESLEILLQRAQIYELTARSVLSTNPRTAQQWLERGIQELSTYQIKNNASELTHYVGYLHIQLSSVLGRLGKFRQVITAAEAGLELLATAPPEDRVSGLVNLASAHQGLAHIEESNRYYHEGVKLAEAEGDIRLLAALWLGISENEGRTGNLNSAVAYLERALNVYRRMGDIYHESGLRLNIGSNYLRLGDELKAQEHLEDSLRLAETYKLTDIEAMALSNLADLYIRNAETAKVDATLAKAHSIANEMSMGNLIPTLIRQQAEVALFKHELQFSLEMIEEALRLATEEQDIEEASICWRVKGVVLYELLKPEQAMSAWQESLKLLNGVDTYELARTKLTIAEAVLQEGIESASSAQAKAWLQEALAAFTTLDAKREIQRVQELMLVRDVL